MSRDLPQKSSSQKNCYIALDKKSQKQHSERIESFPDSLSLEMVANMVDRLATLIEEIPPEQREHLQSYLDFVCSFIKKLRDDYIKVNIRLVASIVQQQFFVRLRSKNIEIDDAIQEGAMGLMRAALLYDPIRGYAFSTYASWWIKCFLRRLLSKSTLIHIPPYLTDSHPPKNKVLPTENYFQRWEEAKRCKNIKSISILSESSSKKSEDLQIPDLSSDLQISYTDDKIDLQSILKFLDPIGKRIIELRFLEGYTLEEVTKILHREGVTPYKVTKERIRQREIRALNMLKRHFNARDAQESPMESTPKEDLLDMKEDLLSAGR